MWSGSTRYVESGFHDGTIRISAGVDTEFSPSPTWKERYGQWAVVTGASDGIGRRAAVRLAEAGLGVVLVARREAVLQALAAELQDASGAEVRVVSADLGTAGGRARVIEQTAALDVGLLVAAAGFGTSGAFLSADAETEADMLAVNCGATLHLTHHFAQRLAARGRGGIVLFGSLVGFAGAPGAAHYAATKAWVQTLAEGLHVELRPRGVDVLSCAPGPTASGFAARADMQMGATVSPDVVALGALRGLGRWGTVRPGFLSWFLEWSLTVPRWLRVRIMGLVMGGMTKHQAGARLESAAT